MYMTAFYGILLPFLGTILGAGCVFFLKRSLGVQVQRALTGFAAGVMVAASIWSLLIPAMEQGADMGKGAVIPAAVGFWLGILFLLILDRLIPHLHRNADQPEGVKSGFGRTTMMLLAVTLHNIPEGMAVGVVYAGFLTGNGEITAAGALALSLGIAIQNFPEGAAVALPMKSATQSRGKAFLFGLASGAVEPLFAIVGFFLASSLTILQPWFLAFAAGAMIFVVAEDLIPDSHLSTHPHLGTWGVMVGFAVMMVLDVALG